MLIIRFRHKKETKLVVKELADQVKMDTDYLLDLYSLLYKKGQNLPTEDRVQKLIAREAKRVGVSAASVGIVAKRRRTQLKEMAQNPIFIAQCRRPSRITALRYLVTSLLELSAKARRAQCMTCALRVNCDFGKQYSAKTADITKVVDPDYAAKVHKDCPELPQIDKTNQIASALAFFAKLAAKSSAPDREIAKKNRDMHRRDAKEKDKEAAALDSIAQMGKDAADVPPPDEDDSSEDAPDFNEEGGPEDLPETYATGSTGGKSNRFDTTFTGQNIIPPEDIVRSLTVSQLALYELGRKFSLALSQQKKGKFKPLVPPSAKTETRNIKAISELSSIDASQHGLPEEVFQHKLERKELTRQQNMEPIEKKQLLYLMLDSSGSMSGWLGQGVSYASPLPQDRCMYTRSAMATILMLALTRHVEGDKGIVYLRFFAGNVSPLFRAETHEEYEALRRQISLCGFNGGGTDIVHAVAAMNKDISGVQGEIARAEALCITDCEDDFAEADLKKARGDTELNILDVSGGQFTNQGVSGMLKACSNHYYKADEASLDVNKLVQLI